MIQNRIRNLVAEIVEMIWKSVEQSDWNPNRALGALEKRLLANPSLATAFLDLRDDEQTEVLALVNAELARRKTPKA